LSYLLTDMPVRCSAVSAAATCTANSSKTAQCSDCELQTWRLGIDGAMP
jgi:hypothetical protein